LGSERRGRRLALLRFEQIAPEDPHVFHVDVSFGDFPYAIRFTPEAGR
jgi:hypothetical protein